MVTLSVDTSPKGRAFPVKRRRQVHHWGIALWALVALTCAGCLPWSASSPTPVALVEFQVTVIYPTALPKPTATPTATDPKPPTSTLAPTNTPAPQPTAAPSPTLERPMPSATLAKTDVATATVQAEATPTGASGSVSGGAPGAGIRLLELRDNVALPDNVGRVEFKWIWEGHGCASPPDGQAFEIRIWPDMPGVTPLGVMDATETDAIACDELSGARSYEVGNLRGAPGVSSVNGGRFRWHVALVELESQALISVSESRAFDLPPGAPTSTPTPTPPRVSLSTGQDAGTINLALPQDNLALPEKTELFEFRWRWSLAAACELPPPGYGFELRIWPDRPEYGPLGAMGDASMSQASVFCDPNTALFGYQIPNLQKTPAVKEAGAGRFRWDVALVRLDPYETVIASGSWAFELPGESKLE